MTRPAAPTPIVILAVLGLAAAAARAQEPVLLRLYPVEGQPMRYRTMVDAWLTTPLLPQGDPALATFHMTLNTVRTATLTDSGLVFTDVTDSSRFDMPRIRDVQPQLPPSGDFMRGLRTETRMDARGRSASTRVLTAPSLPPDLPALMRGMQSLAIAGMRLGTFAFPEQAVAPGDTWTDSLRYDLGAEQSLAPSLVTGGGAGLVTFRFERSEIRGTRRVAMLSATGQVGAAGSDLSAATTVTVTATAQLELDVATGLVIRSTLEMVGPMTTRLGTIPMRLRIVTQAQ